MKAPRDLIEASSGGFRGAWERYWFGEASLLRLAIFRILVLSMALYALEFHKLSLMQGTGGGELVSRRYIPIYLLEVLRIGPLAPEAARMIYYGIWVTISLAMLGVLTRLTCLLSALGMLLWVGMGYSYGQPHHEYGMLAFALCALPLGPVGARLSIDAWWRQRRTQHAPPETAPLAMLPLRFVQVSVAIGYFSAGASKLRFGGLDWVNGYTLQSFMHEFDALLGAWVSEHFLLVRLLSVGVILIQCSVFLALVWRPLRWFYVPAVISVHIGSQFTMDTGTFMGLWMMMASFMDLERVSPFVKSRLCRGPLWRRLIFGIGALGALLWMVSMYDQKGPWPLPLFLGAAWLGGILRGPSR